MKSDKVSIIVPIYNGELYLAKCLDSLINQTYKNIEIICVNDGSTDKSLEILKEYEKKDIRIKIINQSNSGVSISRNVGIKVSTGKYVSFCDADDCYTPKYIEIMINTLKKYNVDVVRCNYLVKNIYGKEISKGDLLELKNKVFTKKGIKSTLLPKILNGKLESFTPLLLIKKDKLTVEFNDKISLMEDVIFYIDLLFNIDNLYMINDLLYIVMYNEEGASNNIKNYRRNIYNTLEVNDNILKLLSKYNALNKNNIQAINISNLNTISGFLFKNYLYTKKIDLCKEIRNNKFLNLVKNTDLKFMNIKKRLIIIFINNKNYFLLKIYLFIAKVVYIIKKYLVSN